MRRRLFLLTTAAVVLTPTLNTAALAAIGSDYVYFDERFAKARVHAGTGRLIEAPIAVRGDVTAVWNETLSSRIGVRPLHLKGVTTQSFVFCLKVLAEDHAFIALDSARLDRDLLEWTLITTPKLLTDRRHG